MRPPPSRIWFDAAARIARQDSIATFNDNQEKVLDYLWDNYPGLYLGTSGEIHTKETILDISRDLSQSVSTANKRERFDFLARGFEQGNLTLSGWDVPLGPVYIKINREENYSRQDRFRPLGAAEKFIETFRTGLESPAPSGSKALLGQILVSAILFGGLLNRKWLRPFQDSLQKKHVYQEGSIFWLDMVESNDRDRTEIHRKETINHATHRLAPDQLTRLLIYRYLRSGTMALKNPVSRDPWINISMYLKEASFPKNELPQSLNELFTWAFARYLTVLPHSLVAYACGKLKATSLPTGPWLRTISGKAIPVSRSASADSAESIGPRPRIIANRDTQKSDQQRLLSDLLKSLRFNKKSKKAHLKNNPVSGKGNGKVSPLRARRIITVFLNNNKSGMCATLQLLLHWSLRLLSDKVSHLERRHKQHIRTVSVDRYLLSFGYALLRVAGDLPLHNLDPQDLEVVYEEVSIRLDKNHFAMNKLRQFHGFLQTFYDVQAMEWSELMESDGKATSEVNANLVTTEIYTTALKSLGWGKAKLTRWQTLHIITLILLYRCGMRPSEVQALRLIDIQGVTKYEILIRNSRLNNIKTNSGIRRLPVSEMLRKDELDLFLIYYRLRIEEDRNYGGGLFLTHPVHFSGLLSDDELFAPIRTLLRSITKDESLRLYHLRHSFLTWADAVLQMEKAQYAWELTETGPPAEDREIIRHLFQSLARNEPLGRKDQYLLAMLAGHASPETTHHHYCHLLDLVLGLHLIDPGNCIQLNHRSVMALTGLQRAAAFELLKVPETVHPLQKIVVNEAAKFKDELRHPLMAQGTLIKQAKGNSLPTTLLPPWEEVIGMQADKRLIALRRSKVEWDFAAGIYEAVRAMDGRKIKTARKVITYARDKYSERWGGISISLESKAKLLMLFLKDSNMPEAHIIAVCHPTKHSSKAENNLASRNWADVLGISHSQVSVGECVPAKLKLKNMITVKITSHHDINRNVRIPRMSTGFIMAIELLHHQCSQ